MSHASILIITAIVSSSLAYAIFWNKLPRDSRPLYYGTLLALLAFSFCGGMLFSDSSNSGTRVIKVELSDSNDMLKTAHAAETHNLYYGDFFTLDVMGGIDMFRYTGVHSNVRVTKNGGEDVKVLSIEVTDGSRLHRIPKERKPVDESMLLAQHDS